jgi:hypothetical protein
LLGLVLLLLLLLLVGVLARLVFISSRSKHLVSLRYL